MLDADMCPYGGLPTAGESKGTTTAFSPFCQPIEG
jgi:hypothetical protein